MRALIDLIRDWLTTHYEYKREMNVCKGCEVARLELERAHELINRLSAPKVEAPIPVAASDEELKPIPGRRQFIPFAVRQQMQNRLDEQSLRLMQASKQQIEQSEQPAVSNEIPIDENKMNEIERDILNNETVINDERMSNA